MAKPEDSPVVLTRPPRMPKPMHQEQVAVMPSRSNSHFLDGFNVAECSDVRCIPDPPSPVRHRRRLSSPLVRTFGDVTNNQEVLKQHKRSRKSLCHVPSPSVEEPAPEQREPKVLQVNIFNEAQANPFTKRRRKRQSMALPQELVVPTATSVPLPPPSAASPLPPFTGSWESMQQLRDLVRSLTSLPRHNRGTSSQAKAIQDLTHYPIATPEVPLDRRAQLQKLGPFITSIDRQKAIDTQEWEHVTGCRVEKSRSGKYRYISIDTELKVPSREYQRLYLTRIESLETERTQRAEEWMRRLEETRPKEERDLGLFNIFSEDASMDICDASASLDLGDASLEMVEEKALSSTEMETLNAQEELPEASPLKEAAPVVPETKEIETIPGSDAQPLVKEDTIPALAPISSVESSDSEITREPEPQKESDITREPEPQEESPPHILPFPDREEQSKDPDIAQAEKRLWSRIDAALKDYSQEVMKIVQSKGGN